MFCSQCGKELNDGAVFCPACGLKIGSVPQIATPSLTPTQASVPAQTAATAKLPQKKKTLIIGAVAAVAIAAVAIVALLVIPPADPKITEFTDQGYRTFLINNFDTNGDGVLTKEERDTVGAIDLVSMGAGDVKVIERLDAFPNLHVVTYDSSQADPKPVASTEGGLVLKGSKNESIKYIDLRGVNVKSVDVSGYTNLVSLLCDPSVEIIGADKAGLEIDEMMTEYTVSSEASSSTVAYTYDGHGNLLLKRITHSNSASVDNLFYEYDESDRLKKVQGKDVRYNNLGLPETYGNETNEFDDKGLLKARYSLLGDSQLQYANGLLSATSMASKGNSAGTLMQSAAFASSDGRISAASSQIEIARGTTSDYSYTFTYNKAGKLANNVAKRSDLEIAMTREFGEKDAISKCTWVTTWVKSIQSEAMINTVVFNRDAAGYVTSATETMESRHSDKTSASSKTYSLTYVKRVGKANTASKLYAPRAELKGTPFIDASGMVQDHFGNQAGMYMNVDDDEVADHIVFGAGGINGSLNPTLKLDYSKAKEYAVKQ